MCPMLRDKARVLTLPPATGADGGGSPVDLVPFHLSLCEGHLRESQVAQDAYA